MMIEEKIYEMYGRKNAELDLLRQDYEKAVAVLRELKKGTILPSQLEILPDGRWQVSPPSISAVTE